ncbi:radical SAM/SPASM domain-containing protein [Paenibacillus sp. FSL M7-1046]|uniref:radical SAM/SPASM domain-containing protein n=1 Tax=Paenibacillus sp. FSL M7-1046 TaxID=2975315 RepID=UPI0030FBB1E9
MVNVYEYKNQFIIHNSNNNGWLCLTHEEYQEFRKIQNKEDTMNLDLLRKTKLYRIFDNNELSLNSTFLSAIENSLPSVVYIVMTDRCNLSCVYCYAEAESSKCITSELTVDEYKTVFNELTELGINEIVFTGGEVGLKKNFYEILDCAFSLGLNCKIITNGSAIFNKVRAQFVADRCTKITVSLDSLDEGKNDMNRGTGCYRVAKQSIQNLIDIGYTNININQTITSWNKYDISDMISFANQHNIQVNIGSYCEMGRGKQSQNTLTISERVQIEKLSIQTKANKITPFCYNLHCGQGVSEFSINPAGNVYTCKLLDTSDFFLGNIRSESLKSILANRFNSVDTKKFMVNSFEKCSDCSFKYLCGGSCRATHYYATNGSDPQNIDSKECEVNKEIIMEHMYLYFNSEGV